MSLIVSRNERNKFWENLFPIDDDKKYSVDYIECREEGGMGV